MTATAWCILNRASRESCTPVKSPSETRTTWRSGSTGQEGLEWHQEQPNYLYVKDYKGPVQVWRRANPYIGEKSPAAGRASRLPFGHPEGFIEAFANIYVNFADTFVRASPAKSPTRSCSISRMSMTAYVECSSLRPFSTARAVQRNGQKCIHEETSDGSTDDALHRTVG